MNKPINAMITTAIRAEAAIIPKEKLRKENKHRNVK